MSEQLCRDGDMFPDREHDPYCDLSRGIGGCNCLPDFGAPERVWIRHGTDVYTRSVPDADEYVLAGSHEDDDRRCEADELVGAFWAALEEVHGVTSTRSTPRLRDAEAALLAALCKRGG